MSKGFHRAGRYKGKHRAPSSRVPVKTLAVAGIAGIYAISSGSGVEAPPPPDPVATVTSSVIVEDLAPTRPITPNPEGDGLEKLNEWLEAGAPGYIFPTAAKGVEGEELQEPVTVVEATCERAPAYTLGLSPNATLVYDTVCALFPEITSFGGLRVGDPQDHGSGNAIDCMIDPVNGDELAAWLLAHWEELPLKYIIWEQRISYGGAWVMMDDRGSPTQNHYDHVHISVN